MFVIEHCQYQCFPAPPQELSPQDMYIGLRQNEQVGRQREGRLTCLVALCDIEMVRERPEVYDGDLFGLDIQK